MMVQFALAYLQRLRQNIDHSAVLQGVREDGLLTRRYMFLVTVSAGIAVLGLLQSSPAVVIGAMLLSPLMGPLIALGLSLAVLDFPQMRRSLLALLVGSVLAIGFAALIVHLSPIQDATPEVLARTRPTLFDLMVAVLSGLAGGHAEVRRKGVAIVGVAIATALMPPLAVVGFGLATASREIAQGAFALFMTNLLAIALSATLVGKVYGFGASDVRGHTAWQTFLILATFGALSVPLGFSLRNIAQETVVSRDTRQVVSAFADALGGRVVSVQTRMDSEAGVRVEALILVRNYAPGGHQALEGELKAVLKRSVRLRLDQVPLGREELLQQIKPSSNPEPALPPVVQSLLARQDRVERVRREISSTVFLPIRALDINPDSASVTIQLAARPAVPLAALREAEQRLSVRLPEWRFELIPPAMALPWVPFESASFELDEQAQAVLEDVRWALQRWQIDRLEVIGQASADRGSLTINRRLAENRATAVAEHFHALGFDVQARADFPTADQGQLEARYGPNAVQRALLRVPDPSPRSLDRAAGEAESGPLQGPSMGPVPTDQR